MSSTRRSGILLHPTSLPGPFGIGTLGSNAHRFVRFLEDAGQRLWQVLPLGPAGYGDSPYQCFSSFAGNPLLVDLPLLADAGLLTLEELASAPSLPNTQVDYGAVIPVKLRLLALAGGRVAESPELDEFRHRNREWLPDYALFMACKEAHGQVAWHHWDPAIRDRKPAALVAWRERLAPSVRAHEACQFLFHQQWSEVRQRCRERGIELMGDVPIYVAHDSADVWSRPELFRLRPDGSPEVVAGVPPDYFSSTGQLWGNPIYRWDVMRSDGYTWWAARLGGALRQFDRVRLDHFRGFEAYWEVAGGEPTAVHGQWVKGPGAELFEALQRRLGPLPIVAENLGVITPEVEAIRERFGLPGMSILQFAFGSDPQAPTFRPHAYPRHVVAYTGTHDNDTTAGWWTSRDAGHSTRDAAEIRRERALALRYLHSDGREIHWDFIRALQGSVADTVIVPLQDVLGLGSDARMNQPATLGGNWTWRFRVDDLTPEHATRLRELAETYDRM